MTSPLMLRFGSDVDSAKAGVTSLAASIASNLASVGGAALTVGKNVQSLAAGTISTLQNIRTTAGLIPPAIFAVSTAFATLVVAQAAIAGLKDELVRLREVAEKSGERGLTAEYFQGFVAAAKGAEDRVKALESALSHAFQATKDSLNPNWSVWDDGLKKITAVEEAMRGMRELFTADQSFSGLELFRSAGNQDQKIQAVLTAMKELYAIGQATAALDLGEKMFGAEFADRLRRGQESVDNLLDTVNRKVGSPEVLSNDTVKRAKELDDRLNDAWRTISERLKPDWDDLGNIALRIKGIWTDIIEAVSRYKAASAERPAFRPYDDQRPGEADAQNSADPNFAAFGNPALLNQYRRRRGFAATGEQTSNEARALDTWSSLNDFSGAPPAEQGNAIPLPRRRPLDAPATPAPTKEDLDAIERMISMMERSNDVLKVELDTAGKSNAEREKGIALAKAHAAARSAGRELTDEEKNQVLALASAHATLSDRLKDVQQAQREAAETARYFGSLASSALADIIIDGKNADDVFQNLAKTLARAALQAAFTGQGPLASVLGFAAPASAGSNAVGGLLGAVTGLFRAGGGDVKAGQAVTIGELGREVFVPDQDGKVYPIGSARSAGVTVVINNNPVFQAGMTPTDQAQIRSWLELNSQQTRALVIDDLRTHLRNDSSFLV